MPSKKIVSGYKKKETFDYLTVPKHFQSVTDGSIHRVKNYCNKVTTQKFAKAGFPQTSFQTMLGSIGGEFLPLYTQLEGDYRARRSNLEVAYNNGVASLDLLAASFRNLLVDYKMKYKAFDEASRKAIGEGIDESLIFDESKLNDIEKDIKRMMEEQKNA